MTVRLDPERSEIEALLEAVPSWDGRRVLEIGCGDGRLTARFAHLPAQVEAIDPDGEQIAEARRALPDSQADRVRFHAVSLEDFEPEPAVPFDIALLSWAL